MSSYNNLSSARASFGSTPSLARVLRELRSFGKPIASKSSPKDKWMPSLEEACKGGDGELGDGDEGDEGDNCEGTRPRVLIVRGRLA